MTTTRDDVIRDRWKEANRLFARTGGQKMKKAILLARDGELHPDPLVASAALDWARLVSSIERKSTRLDDSRPLRVRALVVELATLGMVDLYTGWVRERSLHRDARQIIEANRQPRPEEAA